MNLSSIVSIMPFPNATTYSATKVFDDQLTKSIRESYLKRNIDSLIVQPGIVTTGMTGSAQITGNSCLPEQTSIGSLAQLGLLGHSYGSTIHTWVATQLIATPRPIEHQMKLYMGK